MRGPDVSGAPDPPHGAEAGSGEVCEHGGEPVLDVADDVLEEPDASAGVDENAQDVGPEVARVGGSEPLAGLAEGLAGVARNDAIHDSTPSASVEGCEVRPDRRAIQGRFFHPRHEDGRSEGFPLDVANALQPVSEPEVEPTDPGAEGEGT